jgi:pyruvate/2-oxoglutarate dehydrogenase complex dihydrolipoamide dehydrogenase (E3) component
MKKFDFIIIGSDKQEYLWHFSPSKKGTVALEKSLVGGTCVNTARSSKAYVASARRIWDSKHERNGN